MELAQALSPGAERHAALKKAGLLRQIALLAGQLGTLEKPVRGKRPTRMAKRVSGTPTGEIADDQMAAALPEVLAPN
jgi:hypothetical protein